MGERQDRGDKYFHGIYRGLYGDIRTRFEDVCPGFGDMIVDFGYGDVMSNETLSARDREFATLAALIALGDTDGQLEAHIRGGLNVGITREQMGELCKQMALYAGFPRTMNALVTLRRVLNDFDKASEGEQVSPSVKGS